MNFCRKSFLLLASAVALLFIGANAASAQCVGSVSATTSTLRIQGNTEALGKIAITCTATPATSVPSNVSVILSPTSINALAGAGTSTAGGWTNTCSATAADNKSTF